MYIFVYKTKYFDDVILFLVMIENNTDREKKLSFAFYINYS